MIKCELSSPNMEAARLVGRVGALAVALGVGAMWFSGGVASADSSDSGTSGPAAHSRSTDDNSTSRAARANRGVPGAAATRAAARNKGPSAAAGRRAAAVAAPLDVTPAETPALAGSSATPTSSTSSTSPTVSAAAAVAPSAVSVAEAAPAAASVAAPAPVAAASGEVSAFATAGGDAPDPAAGSNPNGTVDSPLSWTVAAFARRTGVPGAAAVAPPTYTQANCTASTTACTFVLSPSGVPIPSQGYIDTVMKYYVLPNSTTDQTAQGVSTPEGAYPVTGVKSLPIAISVPLGQTILENTINAFTPGPQPGSTPVTIFGYSQSAIISSLIQREMADQTQVGYLPGLNRDTTRFITVGQEMAPDGGWYARFPGLNLPSLGWTLYGSTPENAFPTTNYTLEYDGFADSPKYPGNFLSDLNAALGILAVHIQYGNQKYFQNTYATVDPMMAAYGPGYACNNGGSSCTLLPSTSPDQKYYFIKTPNLPLLLPVRAIPFVGNAIADLVQPFLKVIVDLGYADPAHGFTSQTQPPANVPMPFKVFPPVSPVEVLKKLVAAVPQGIKDFVDCIGSSSCRKGAGAGISVNVSLKEILQTLPLRISAAVSALVAPLLPLADFVNAATIGMANYSVSVIAEGVKQALAGLIGLPPGGVKQFIQGVINAVFRPIAANIGMLTTFVSAEATVALLGVVGAITGCGPGAPTSGLCILG